MSLLSTALLLSGQGTCPCCTMRWQPLGDRAFLRGVIVCPRCLTPSRLDHGLHSLKSALLPGISSRESVHLQLQVEGGRDR